MKYIPVVLIAALFVGVYLVTIKEKRLLEGEDATDKQEFCDSIASSLFEDGIARVYYFRECFDTKDELSQAIENGKTALRENQVAEDLIRREYCEKVLNGVPPSYGEYASCRLQFPRLPLRNAENTP